MNIIKSIGIAIVLTSTALLNPAFAAAKGALEEAMSYDGLKKITVKDIDLAYARPGATLAGYSKVKIDPIQVSFHKNWDPKRSGSETRLSPEERENIRSGVAKIVYEEFVKELKRKSTYEVVETAGPDVLRVKAMVANLYVTAPATLAPGRTRTFTATTGEMTLVAELCDSETDQILARIIDRSESRDAGMMTLSNSAVNVSEAIDIASTWGRILRNGLDKAHGIGKK